MNRCVQFYDKLEEDAEFCELDPSERSRIKIYLTYVTHLKNTGLDKESIIRKFTSGAARPIITEKDENIKTDALNYVADCLTKGEKITDRDVKGFIAVAKVLKSEERPVDKCQDSGPVKEPEPVIIQTLAQQIKPGPEPSDKEERRRCADRWLELASPSVKLAVSDHMRAHPSRKTVDDILYFSVLEWKEEGKRK